MPSAEVLGSYWSAAEMATNGLILLNLLGALALGLLVGYERSYHGRAAGMRTYGLVCMASAALTVIGGYPGFWFGGHNAVVGMADPTRIVQGIVTGIGFLGAGVIVLDNGSAKIKGLTTAASIWMTACIGIVCGMGAWRVAGIGLILVMLLFLLGHPLERMLHKRWLGKSEHERTEIDMHE